MGLVASYTGTCTQIRLISTHFNIHNYASIKTNKNKNCRLIVSLILTVIEPYYSKGGPQDSSITGMMQECRISIPAQTFQVRICS